MSRSRPTVRPRLLFLAPILALAFAWGSHLPAAHAGMLASTTNALNYNSIEWRGAVDIAAGTFEYAVFAPGDFADFLAENSIVAPDPTSPLLGLTYAYQLIDPKPGANVTTISVGELVNHDAISHPAGAFPAMSFDPTPIGGNEKAPHPALRIDAGVNWSWGFPGNAVTPGFTSTILFFQSPFLPEFDQVSAASPIETAVESVASISRTLIPEPSAIVLALLAVSGVFTIRRRHG